MLAVQLKKKQRNQISQYRDHFVANWFCSILLFLACLLPKVAVSVLHIDLQHFQKGSVFYSWDDDTKYISFLTFSGPLLPDYKPSSRGFSHGDLLIVNCLHGSLLQRNLHNSRQVLARKCVVQDCWISIYFIEWNKCFYSYCHYNRSVYQHYISI